MALVVVIPVVVIGARKASDEGRKLRSLRERIAAANPGCELFMSFFDRSVIAISFDREKVIFGTMDGERDYDFSKIIGVEIVENGATLTQTNRGSQLAGAAVGGLVFGAIGALAGGLSGSTVTQSRVKELSLKVIVEDIAEPILRVSFWRDEAPEGSDRSNKLLKEAVAKLERIHALLCQAMRKGTAN